MFTVGEETLPECQAMKLQQRFTSVLHRWNACCYAVAPNFSSVDTGKHPPGPFSWLNENLKTRFKGLVWTRWHRMMRPNYKNSKFSCMRSSSDQMFNLINCSSESSLNNQLVIIQLTAAAPDLRESALLSEEEGPEKEEGRTEYFNVGMESFYLATLRL